MRYIDRNRSLVAALLIAALSLPLSAGASQLSTDPAEVMRYFEENVEDWGKGPANYLFLPDERDIWRELDTDDERREFIAWFWDRRDEDLRDRRNPFKEGFYERVASANQRFQGFPRGWRSDRGRVWIVLGQPDSLRGGLETEVWTYFTYGGILRSSSNMGEMQVQFVRMDVGKWEIYGGVGPGAWPVYVLRAFEIVNHALIENPSLEWGK